MAACGYVARGNGTANGVWSSRKSWRCVSALLFNTPPTPGLQLCSNTRRGKPRCPCSASEPRTWRLTAVVGCPLVSSAPFAPPSMSDEHVHDQAKQMMAKVRIVVSSPPPSA